MPDGRGEVNCVSSGCVEMQIVASVEADGRSSLRALRPDRFRKPVRSGTGRVSKEIAVSVVAFVEGYGYMNWKDF